MRQADSHESLEFPIRANHATKLQSDSEHPIFIPLLKNSRNMVYKLRFASLQQNGQDTHCRQALQQQAHH